MSTAWQLDAYRFEIPVLAHPTDALVSPEFAIELGRSHREAICVGLHPGTVDTGLSEPFQRGVPAERLFTPRQSAEHLLRVLGTLTPADSGGCFAWGGTRICE